MPSYSSGTVYDEQMKSSLDDDMFAKNICGFNDELPKQLTCSDEIDVSSSSRRNSGKNNAIRGWSNLVKTIQSARSSSTTANNFIDLVSNDEENKNNGCDKQTTTSSIETVTTYTSNSDARKNFADNIRRNFKLPGRRMAIPLHEPNMVTMERSDCNNVADASTTARTSASEEEDSSDSQESEHACNESEEAQSVLSKDIKQDLSPSSTTSLVVIDVSRNEDESNEASLAEALSIWIEATNALMKSREMDNLIQSSLMLSHTTTTVAIYTITLPIRIPYSICTSAAQLILSATNNAISQSYSYITSVIVRPALRSSTGESTESESNNIHPFSIVIHSVGRIPGILVWTIPITCVGIAANITNDIASSVLSVVTGNQGTSDFDTSLCFDELELTEEDGENQTEAEQHMVACSNSQTEKVARPWKWFGRRSEAGQSTAEQGQVCQRHADLHSPSIQAVDFLDRLRLDYAPASRTSPATEPLQSQRIIPPLKIAVSDDKSQMVDDTKIAVCRHAYSSLLKHFKTPTEDTKSASPASDDNILHYAYRAFEGRSQHLLRINDVEVKIANRGNGLKAVDSFSVCYLDLALRSEDDMALLRRSLDKLVLRGLSMLANHPPARLSSKAYVTSQATDIKWNPAGSTTKDVMRKMSQMSNKMERIEVLKRETLSWTGEYVHQKGFEGYGRNFAIYLARGILEFTPINFLRLLWDDARTKEYNQYSNGRSADLTIVSDDILGHRETEPIDDETLTSTKTTGTKAIRSETRVPLTKFTLQTRCLMHVRALDAPDDGFVIITRSLDEGDAGLHLHDDSFAYQKKKSIDKCDNQIVWGMNIIKAVPNNPHLTDLISLSQVSTPNVPGFLAKRIATMGIEDFFTNVRKIGKNQSSTN